MESPCEGCTCCEESTVKRNTIIETSEKDAFVLSYAAHDGAYLELSFTDIEEQVGCTFGVPYDDIHSLDGMITFIKGAKQTLMAQREAQNARALGDARLDEAKALNDAAERAASQAELCFETANAAEETINEANETKVTHIAPAASPTSLGEAVAKHKAEQLRDNKSAA